MVRVVVAEMPVEVNERGFLKNLAKWSPEAAQYLARRQGTDRLGDLTADHWRVIEYLRSHYQRFGAAPSLQDVCTDLDLTKGQFSDLFPGAMTTARRISGLPGPRRSANGRGPSDAELLATDDWWVRLTR